MAQLENKSAQCKEMESQDRTVLSNTNIVRNVQATISLEIDDAVDSLLEKTSTESTAAAAASADVQQSPLQQLEKDVVALQVENKSIKGEQEQMRRQLNDVSHGSLEHSSESCSVTSVFV